MGRGWWDWGRSVELRKRRIGFVGGRGEARGDSLLGKGWGGW